MGLVSIVRFRISSSIYLEADNPSHCLFINTPKIKKLLKVPIFAIFERPGKSCTHFFSGGKAAEERPRICVNLAICTKRLQNDCTDAHKMPFYSLSNKLSFNLLSCSRVSPSSGYCVSPYAIYSVDLKYKDAVLQNDLRQRMDQYQPL